MSKFKTSIIVEERLVDVTVNDDRLIRVQPDPTKVDISKADKSACGDIPEGEQCDNFLRYDVTGRQISGALVFSGGTDRKSGLRSICTWVPSGKPNPDLFKSDRFSNSLFTPLADRCVKAILERGEKATVIEPLRVHPMDILKTFVVEAKKIIGEPLVKLVEGINAQAVKDGLIKEGENIFAGLDQGDIAKGLERLAQVAGIVGRLEEEKKDKKNQEVLDLAAKMPKGADPTSRENSWLTYVKDEIVSRWAERHSELLDTGTPLSPFSLTFLGDPTKLNLVYLVRYINKRVADEDTAAVKAAVTGTYKGEPPKWDEGGGAAVSVDALKKWLVNVVKLQENMTMPDLIKKACIKKECLESPTRKDVTGKALPMSIYELRDALDAVKDDKGYNAIRDKLAAAAKGLPQLPSAEHPVYVQTRPEQTATSTPVYNSGTIGSDLEDTINTGRAVFGIHSEDGFSMYLSEMAGNELININGGMYYAGSLDPKESYFMVSPLYLSVGKDLFAINLGYFDVAPRANVSMFGVGVQSHLTTNESTYPIFRLGLKGGFGSLGGLDVAEPEKYDVFEPLNGGELLYAKVNINLRSDKFLTIGLEGLYSNFTDKNGSVKNHDDDLYGFSGMFSINANPVNLEAKYYFQDMAGNAEIDHEHGFSGHNVFLGLEVLLGHGDEFRPTLGANFNYSSSSTHSKKFEYSNFTDRYGINSNSMLRVSDANNNHRTYLTGYLGLDFPSLIIRGGVGILETKYDYGRLYEGSGVFEHSGDSGEEGWNKYVYVNAEHSW